MTDAAPITVTDHALIRWLERVHGVDVDRFREYIASLTQDAINLGATSIQIDGFLYVLNPARRSVVTIFTPEQRKNRLPHLRGTLPLVKRGAA
jgi:hypothetical protein